MMGVVRGDGGFLLTPNMTSPSASPAASEYDSRSVQLSISGPGGRPGQVTGDR